MRAICIGSAVVDIITIVASRDVERLTMHNATSSFLMFEQGRKIEAESISPHIGGGAVNAAVAMKRLGLDAAALVKLGRDRNGEQVLERLEAEKIDDSLVSYSDELPTGTSVIVSSHDRNATIFTQRGTNTLLRPEDMEAELLAGSDLVLVSNLSNRSSDCFPIVVERARDAGAFVAANPGIRQLTSRGASLFDSLPHIDLLAINRVEAEALVPALIGRSGGNAARAADTGKPEDLPKLMQLGLSCGGFDLDLADFLALMVSEGGVRQMLVTDGILGAYLADAAGIHYCPALLVEAKGTAGAGDAFVSTTATCLARGEAPTAALQAAACNAAGVVAEIDTQMGLMDQAGLAAAVAANGPALATRTWPWRQQTRHPGQA